MSAETLIAQARLALKDVPRMRLGTLVVPRRILAIARAPRITPTGEAWHLGVLLVGEHEVWSTGDIVRAHDEVRRGYTAESQRERAALAAAAFRGGFAEGESVHLGWRPINLAAPDEPLALIEGVPHVRWSTAGGYRPLDEYLRERISLAIG